jgi:hypothetical protein
VSATAASSRIDIDIEAIVVVQCITTGNKEDEELDVPLKVTPMKIVPNNDVIDTNGCDWHDKQPSFRVNLMRDLQALMARICSCCLTIRFWQSFFNTMSLAIV